ncbi:hypothetical protein GA0115239_10986 [Streptomyces sp. BpilaLS-43]|nr:hypothetical protein GA0115239_10986 [Streptomyces sp. BpilaLS-43]
MEKHVAAVFTKFGLRATDTDNRRVKAVLAYLAETRGRPPVTGGSAARR